MMGLGFIPHSQVWASKWTDRAWLSRRACGVPEGDLFMSVLLQQVCAGRVPPMKCGPCSKHNNRLCPQSSRHSGLRRLTLCPHCPRFPQVVPAQYAFVLHTAHPITRNRGDMFGEMVVGLGETLVGNYPGRALAFVGAEGAPPLR